MKRFLSIESLKHIDKRIKVSGRVSTIRSHGQIVFLDIRDRSGLLQVVSSLDLVQGVKEEDVLEIVGQVKERPDKMVNPNIITGKVELEAEEIKVLASAEVLPFDLKSLNLRLPTLLDNRPLSLRNEKIQAIFKVEEGVVDSFRKTLKGLDFYEFQAPVIVPSNAEGGAEVFHVDYYEADAFLTQSPQLYKQIMLSGFERVFTVNHVFRAEPSFTTRHLSEYISLDLEMSFIDSWEEVMATCQKVIQNIVSDLGENHQKELKLWQATLPKVKKEIPRIKMRQAQEIIFQRTGRDNRHEPDLSPEDEKEICQYALEEYDSDFIFITHYPTKKRPFYTYADPEDPEHTLSFDLLCRGLEIVTGGQRINDYQKLIANIKKWGNQPKNFTFYLQAFKYGMPPEGGFALGLERIVKQTLALENVREASLFPRDAERIDLRLTVKKSKKK